MLLPARLLHNATTNRGSRPKTLVVASCSLSTRHHQPTRQTDTRLCLVKREREIIRPERSRHNTQPQHTYDNKTTTINNGRIFFSLEHTRHERMEGVISNSFYSSFYSCFLLFWILLDIPFCEAGQDGCHTATWDMGSVQNGVMYVEETIYPPTI